VSESKREHLERILADAKRIGAYRTVRLVEGQLADLDKPKPQKIVDCEKAAELAAEYRRTKAGAENATPLPVPEIEPDTSSISFQKELEAETNAALAELRSIGITPKGSRQ
jgi:hypothetical protein